MKTLIARRRVVPRPLKRTCYWQPLTGFQAAVRSTAMSRRNGIHMGVALEYIRSQELALNGAGRGYIERARTTRRYSQYHVRLKYLANAHKAYRVFSVRTRVRVLETCASVPCFELRRSRDGSPTVTFERSHRVYPERNGNFFWTALDTKLIRLLHFTFAFPQNVTRA